MSDPFDESAVSRGLREGDRNAWAALFDQFSARVWRYVARLIGGRAADVSDIVQETFLSAARSARGFDSSQGTLWSWLSGIAHHVTAKYWREAERERRLHRLAAEHQRSPASQPAAPADPLDCALAGEAIDLVRAALAGLTADYAFLLTARHLDGLSISDIQTLCGGTSDALRSRLTRARQAFRDEFERLIATCPDPDQEPRPTDCRTL